MNIIPAIDLLNGKCVRLFQGKFDQATEYSDDPVSMAQLFERSGAKWLHIVDLNGALNGQLTEMDLIKNICDSTELKVQVGGGIRTIDTIKNLFDIGVARVVIGSLALEDINLVKSWLNFFGGERIVLALDINHRNGTAVVCSNGWQKDNDQSLWDILERYRKSPLSYVLCTDISRDGALSGPNIELYKQCLETYPDISFIASGGVTNTQDLVNLQSINMENAIVGKALYEKKINLEEVFTW